MQNYLGDLAEVLERLHSLITWADPRATLIFLFACILGALAIATFSLPVVLSIGLCYTVSGCPQFNGIACFTHKRECSDQPEALPHAFNLSEEGCVRANAMLS